MDTVIQILMAMVGTLGFCLLFHVESKHIPDTTIGGGLCWGAYLLFMHLNCGVFLSTFLASALIGIYGQIFAHMRKAPTTVYYIPACIPLIPGSNLYYMLRGLISQDWNSCAENAKLLALYAVGIALGFWVIQELDEIRLQLKQKKTAP